MSHIGVYFKVFTFFRCAANTSGWSALNSISWTCLPWQCAIVTQAVQNLHFNDASGGGIWGWTVLQHKISHSLVSEFKTHLNFQISPAKHFPSEITNASCLPAKMSCRINLQRQPKYWPHLAGNCKVPPQQLVSVRCSAGLIWSQQKPPQVNLNADGLSLWGASWLVAVVSLLQTARWKKRNDWCALAFMFLTLQHICNFKFPTV